MHGPGDHIAEVASVGVLEGFSGIRSVGSDLAYRVQATVVIATAFWYVTNKLG
jgi:hypothetical protein